MTLFWLLLSLFVCIIHGAQKQRDPYKILKVPRKVGSRQIKKAFRQQSRKWHPDKHLENKAEAEERFKDVAWAHDILSNETLRKAYDEYGIEGVERVERGGSAGSARGFPNMFPHGVPFNNFMFHGPGGGFYNMFEEGSHFDTRQGIPEVTWFDDSPVELLSPKNRLDIDEMNPNWPDVFFLFRDVEDSTEKAAKVIVTIAEDMRSTLEFQAVDCRQTNELCAGLSRGKGPYEIHLVTQQTARAAINSEKPKPVKSAARALQPSGKKPIDSLSVLKWLLRYLPEDYQVLSSFSSLEKFCKGNAPSPHPTLVIVNNEDVVNVKLRKWITDSKFRVKFGVVAAADTTFRRELIQRFETLMPKDKILKPAYIIHIPDIEALHPSTVEFVKLGIDETALDLTIAKYVGMKKVNSGVYSMAAKQMRPLTSTMMKQGTGACTKFDNKFCLFYVKDSRKGDKSKRIQSLFEKMANDGMRLYLLDLDKQAAFLRPFGVSGESLIAYRPKRLKYIKLESEINEKNIETFFESVSDGTSILSKGIKLDTWPIMV